MEPNDSLPQRCAPARWVPALILIGVGAIFLLNNLHIFYLHDIFRYWPVALIAGGIFKLVDSSTSSGRTLGGILIAAGGLLLSINLGYLDLSWGDLWPLFLIGAGLLMLTERLSPGIYRRSSRRWNQSWGGKSLRESAVFGGGKRVITDPAFSGGKVDAVFAGYEIDLRGATMAGDSAQLEVNAVFGGVEVKIPTTWHAVIKGAGVFGAYVDNTRHPKPAEVPNPKQIIFKGGAVFGAVEIKN